MNSDGKKLSSLSHKLISFARKDFVLTIKTFQGTVEQGDFLRWFEADFEETIFVRTDDPGGISGEFMLQESTQSCVQTENIG